MDDVSKPVALTNEGMAPQAVDDILNDEFLITFTSGWDQIKDTVIQSLFKARYHARCQVIEWRYIEYQHRVNMSSMDRRNIPTPQELCHLLPELKRRIGTDLVASLPPDIFADIEDRFPELILCWENVLKEDIRLEFADARMFVVEFPPPGRGVEEHDLALCLLRCPRCRTMLFGLDEAKQHHCCPPKALMDPPANFHEYITRPHILCTTLLPRIEEVVGLHDLDAKVATIRKMDALDPIIRCTICTREDGSQEYFTWRSYVSSWYTVYNCRALFTLLVRSSSFTVISWGD